MNQSRLGAEMVADIKEGDVFRFAWSEAERKKRFMPDHCFDGQLVATKYPGDGALKLVDTYWGSSGDNKAFTPDDARAKGTLLFVCNLNDVEAASADVAQYYSREDWFDLSYQHGCYQRFVLRKGAVKNQSVMMESVTRMIDATEREIEWKRRSLDRLKGQLAAIQSGKTDAHIF